MGEWAESSDKSSAESEVPKWKPLKKKLKLSVPKDKESQWQFVDDATEVALSKEFVPKSTATSTKWAVSNFVAWRTQVLQLHIFKLLCVMDLILSVSPISG